ncbi:MAG: hypothetical protein BWY71_01774 [Planctomycetes bacterium ADurb.Bin412]|nr:MAG: hypothetical protein BWY71_01774 [Planctomycetes bacterium ADurb.Bin412]
MDIPVIIGIIGPDPAIRLGALSDMTEHVPDQTRVAIPRFAIRTGSGKCNAGNRVFIRDPIPQPFDSFPSGTIDIGVLGTKQHSTHRILPQSIEHFVITGKLPDQIKRIETVYNLDIVQLDRTGEDLDHEVLETEGVAAAIFLAAGAGNIPVGHVPGGNRLAAAAVIGLGIVQFQ